MAEDKYLNEFKKNVGVVADRLRALKYFSFREVVDDEDLRTIQYKKREQAGIAGENTILKSKMSFSIEICTDFELEFMRRKMAGWLRIYNKVNTIKLSKAIQREQECLKEVEDEILRRKPIIKKPKL